MIRSMTGFASVSREEPAARVTVTVKSVNHRFLDVAVKAPQSLGMVESRIRAIVQQRLARGRVEITVAADVTSAPEREVVIDEPLLARIVAAVDEARARGAIDGRLTASDLLRVPQLIEIRSRTSDDTAAAATAAATTLIEHAVGDAIDALVVMRDTEGRFIASDAETRLASIEGFVNLLEEEARAGQQQLEARLRERLAGLPPDLHADQAMLAQEIVRFVARSDVDEEIVRMRGHLEHWRGLAAGPEPCGRKLDFLVQEMNREINTIGSKVEGLRGTELVINAKAELERIREQVQNVE